MVRWVVLVVTVSALGWLLGGVPVQAAEIALVPPPDGSYRPDSAITFSLVALPDEVADRLSLELNGMDVTRFVQREGNLARLVFPIPLSPGTYRLRVVDVRADGSLVELAVWEVEIRSSKTLREASLRGNVSLEIAQRVADHRSPDLPNRTQFRGTAQLFGRLAGEDWEVHANLPVLYSRNRFVHASQQPWDLGAYRVEGRHGRFSARVGHFAPDPTSMILEQFHRRGASVQVDLPEFGSRLMGFSLRGNSISGFEEGLGIRDRNRRVNGIVLSGRPIEVPGGVLDLSATVLRGRSGLGGAAVAGPVATQSGTAWSLVADAAFFESRLRVRGEYARARFDPDADAEGSSERDDAYSFLFAVTPVRNWMLADRPLTSEIRFEQREVGPDFGSPGNPASPVDRELREIVWRTTWAGLVVHTSFAREWDNVDSLEERPRFRSDSFYGSLFYSPDFLEPGGRFVSCFGRPFVEVSVWRTRLKPISSPDPQDLVLGNALAFTPIYADQSQRTTSVRLGSTYTRWSWNLSHSVGRLEDRTRTSPDTRSDLTAFQVSLPLRDRGSLSLSLQRNRFKQEDLGLQNTSWTGTVWTRYAIVPGRLSTWISASLTRSRNSTSSLDSRIVTASGALDWKAISARFDRPGLSLILEGTYQHRMDDVNFDLTTDVFQIFVKARLDWPIQFE